MMWLLLATGFLGGLTLVFLLRLAQRTFGSPAGVEAHFTPGKCVEPLVGLVGKARREVLLLARSVGSPALAQALVDAKLRGVKVEIVLDPAAAEDPAGDYAFFVDQSLAPTVRPKEQLPLHENLLVVDEQRVATGSFGFAQAAEEKGVSHVLTVAGHPEFAHACREHFLAQRGTVKAVEEEKKDDSPSAQLGKTAEAPLKTRLGKAREALDAATGAAAATGGKAASKNAAPEPAAVSS